MFVEGGVVVAAAVFETVSITESGLRSGIGPNFADMPNGTYVVCRLSGGSITSAVYDGQTAQGYRVSLHSGDQGKAGRLLQTRHHDRSGNITVFETPDERWTYRPHNCARTLGTCRYAANNRGTGGFLIGLGQHARRLSGHLDLCVISRANFGPVEPLRRMILV